MRRSPTQRFLEKKRIDGKITEDNGHALLAWSGLGDKDRGPFLPRRNFLAFRCTLETDCYSKSKTAAQTTQSPCNKEIHSAPVKRKHPALNKTVLLSSRRCGGPVRLATWNVHPTSHPLMRSQQASIPYCSECLEHQQWICHGKNECCLNIFECCFCGIFSFENYTWSGLDLVELAPLAPPPEQGHSWWFWWFHNPCRVQNWTSE